MVQIFHRKLNKKNFQIKQLYKFVDNFFHFHHAYDFRKKEFRNIQNNLYNLIYLFGYGNCKHVSLLVQYNLDINKIKNKIIILQSKDYSHVVNLIYFNNKNFIVDPFGKFHFECTMKNNSITAKKLPIKKIKLLLKKQYYTALSMGKRHQFGKNFLARDSYKLYKNALSSFTQFKSKISLKKTCSKFPVYNNSQIKPNGIGIYDGKKFNSNLYIKFKNIENITFNPKKHFNKYKYGLIVNFKIKFKNKKNFMHLYSNKLNLKKYVRGKFYELANDKKSHSEFLKKPNFLLKFKNYKNIAQLNIISILSSFYK